MNIVALVVTYNRKELLCECINAILEQSCLPNKIVVLDNASTDGTADLFKEDGMYNIPIIEYIRSTLNTGGAGGFYQGIKHCMKDSEWIWLMDDDTIPDKDALKGLCEGINDLSKERISFLASKVIGPNGEAMNLPTIDMTPSENGYSDWYMNLENKLVKIKTATFVSLLINTKAIEKVGLPLSWYFIWGDDTEYTLRLTTQFGKAYFSGKSLVVHKRFNARQLSIWEEENENRLNMYFYFMRNLLLNISKYNSKKDAILQIIKWELKCVKSIFNRNIKFRVKKVLTIQKGIFSYIFHIYSEKQVDE